MSLKQRLAAGELTVGGWSTVGHPQIVEAMASTGTLDWIVVDLEHTGVTLDQAAALFLACERHGVAPLARLSGHDPIEGRRALDLGAAGLLVPVVESAEAFERLARHFVYPPAGRRGACLARINRWGEDFDAYGAAFAPVLIPQIETPAGVRETGAIAALACVDALFIGPYDLSAALGAPGDFTTAAFREAEAAVHRAVAPSGKPLGIHVVAPEAAPLRERIGQGYRFVAFGTDMICVRASLKRAVAARD